MGINNGLRCALAFVNAHTDQPLVFYLSHAHKARIASFIDGFKNDQSYELIDEEILKIHQV